MSKDIHRYSYSRLSSYRQCPRKHYYNYVEGIETPENEFTTPGKMFHECIEHYLKNEDFTPVLQEFRKLCMRGELPYEPDLLEYSVSHYLQYWAKEYATEKNVLVEQEFSEQLEGDDVIIGYIDAVYDRGGHLGIRDMKTTVNKLKYTYDDVLYNVQLNLYIPFAEDLLKQRIETKQIDEIRLAKLQPVPLTRTGKPSKAKENLELVTYEDYYDALAERGLENEADYQGILDFLKDRGHPLFRRITVQVLDEALISNNAAEILDVYKASKTNATFRVKSNLCRYCAFQELCKLDYTNPSEASREIIIDKIKKSTE